MKSFLLTIGLLVIFVFSFSVLVPSASAHRSGCHRWHSCPSDTGSYICGDLGYNSECPTVNTQPTRTPVISVRNAASEEVEKYSEETRYVYDEYEGYTKVIQEGLNGIDNVTTPITYTDGVETSRGTPQKTIKTSPTNKITLVGARIKPQAIVESVSKTKKKDKYDISGTYKPSSEVVLSLNNKKIKRAKTDKDGKFTFKGIKIKNSLSEIKIYKRENRKESQVSELTYVQLNPYTIKTEYQKTHNS